MTYPAISLSPTLVADIFPFHLAINAEWKLIQIGRVLQRLCPELKPGCQFEQHFQIQRPNTTLNFDEIQAHLQSLFIVEAKQSSILLKGQMVYVTEQALLLFLGSPWVPDLDTLASSGLALADFAMHDPVADYLILLQAQKIALSDARNLADKLMEQREKVRKALQREKELNDLKSRFITTASHEFRTPLGIIASSAGIIQEYADRIDRAMQQKHLERIQSAVNRMTGLLNDVLTMSHIETGTLKANFHPIKPAFLCQEIVDAIRKNTAHTLEYTISLDLIDCVVSLDQALLKQLLINLLSNAVKYTPEPGHISLEIKMQDDQIVFVIQDSGIGIPPEELPSIFNPFHRANNVGNIAGTGLGLAIAKHCVDLHNGSLAIVSEVGVGTIITVSIPVQRTPAEPKEESVVC